MILHWSECGYHFDHILTTFYHILTTKIIKNRLKFVNLVEFSIRKTNWKSWTKVDFSICSKIKSSYPILIIFGFLKRSRYALSISGVSGAFGDSLLFPWICLHSTLLLSLEGDDMVHLHHNWVTTPGVTYSCYLANMDNYLESYSVSYCKLTVFS